MLAIAYTNAHRKMERRSRWVRDLRSGDFRQGITQLAIIREGHPTNYCCLGVGCQRYMDDTGDGMWQGTGVDTSLRLTAGETPRARDKEPFFMPGLVEEWFGLDELEYSFSRILRENGVTLPHNLLSPVNDIQNILSMCNDRLYMTFEEIAQVIEYLEDMDNHIPEIVSVARKIVDSTLESD